MSCRVFARVLDDRSGRTTEQLVWQLEDDLTPAAALAAFIDAEQPVAGTYRVEVELHGRRRTAVVTYAPEPSPSRAGTPGQVGLSGAARQPDPGGEAAP